MQFLQSPPGQEPVVISGIFKAPLARVYQVWTDPAEVKQWFGSKPNSLHSASIDLKVGGAWCFAYSDKPEALDQLEGKYIEIEENTKLVFSWRHVKQVGDELQQTAYSKVTVLFIAAGDSTRVDLRHEAIIKENGRQGVGRGWQASFEHIDQLLQ